MSDAVLADGERVVRRYPCTAVDRVALVAGTVIPLPGGVESEGVLTLTNRRLIFELEADGGARDRQEARLSEVSSVSSMMSKFGRDLRLPIALVIIGFILMVGPYAVLSEAGAFDGSGDYSDGYDDGVEYGYFETYLRAVQNGTAQGTIPDDYVSPGVSAAVSQEYYDGYTAGYADGSSRASSDIAAGLLFSVPEDLMTDDGPSLACIIVAAVGAVVFVMGSVLYYVSNTTKDWVGVRIGSGSRAIAVKSFDGSWSSTGHRALVADDQYWSMTRELGAAILDLRGYRESRIRFADDDDDVTIEPQPDDGAEAPQEGAPAGASGLMEAPDFEDYREELVIVDDDDDEDGPRVVAPWRDDRRG